MYTLFPYTSQVECAGCLMLLLHKIKTWNFLLEEIRVSNTRGYKTMAASVAKNLPLSGIRVLEFAGLAPAPFAGMILADFGANVFRVDRAGETSTLDSLSRGKRSISLNLKSKKGVDVIRRLSSNTDILLEPYRPGVMEKFGLGPEVLCGVNERLVYTRLNGK